MLYNTGVFQHIDNVECRFFFYVCFVNKFTLYLEADEGERKSGKMKKKCFLPEEGFLDFLESHWG